MDDQPLEEIKVYSPAEIEIFLSGDRREVDRLLLHGLNNIAAVLIPHAKHEEAREKEFLAGVHDLGGFDMIKKRAAFVDSVIKQQDTRTAMMEKVSQSTAIWAVLAFLLLLAHSVWDYVVEAVKHKIGG